MLRVVPRHWFSWEFVVVDAGEQPLAELSLSFWGEGGAVRVPGAECTVSREGFIAGAFVLEGDGSIVARADKLSLFGGAWAIDCGGKQYVLEARHAFTRERVLFEEEREIGSIRPESVLTRGAIVDLPEGLPLLLRMFVVWLTMLLWKRKAG